MNTEQQTELDRLISENNVVDQTDVIRSLKQSVQFKKDVDTMMAAKQAYAFKSDNNIAMGSPIYEECRKNCPFLFKYYAMVFHKILKDDIDMGTLDEFIKIVEEIEEGKLTQHEGAFKFGTLAKSLYIDDVLHTANMVDADGNEIQTTKIIAPPPARKISWNQYKQSRNNISRKLIITKSVMQEL